MIAFAGFLVGGVENENLAFECAGAAMQVPGVLYSDSKVPGRMRFVFVGTKERTAFGHLKLSLLLKRGFIYGPSRWLFSYTSIEQWNIR